MTTARIVGHFHGDHVVCAACCPWRDGCGRPDAKWPFYPTDVAQGFAAARCERCGKPVCTDEQTTAARAWAEQYG